MNLSKPLRWLLAGLLFMLLLTALAGFAVHSFGPHGSILIDDMDLSDSMLGWMIAIPILTCVAIMLVVIFAGVGVIVAGVLTLVLGGLAVAALIFMLPVLLFLAIPLMVLIGLVRLFTRPRLPPQHSTI